MFSNRIVRSVCAFGGLAVAALVGISGCACEDSGDCPAIPFVSWSCEGGTCIADIGLAHPTPGKSSKQPQSQIGRKINLFGAIPVDAALLGNALDRDLSAGPVAWHAERLVEAAR